jgi:hypothetical protein
MFILNGSNITKNQICLCVLNNSGDAKTKSAPPFGGALGISYVP